MIDTQKHIRKPLYVDAVRITTANFDEVAAWCQGEVLEENNKRYIKVRVHNPKNPRQTKAFVGDWLLYTERGYKVYTNRAFHASFDAVEGAEPEQPVETFPDGSVMHIKDATGRVLARKMPNGTYLPPLEESVSEMTRAVQTIESEDGTVEPATPEAIAEVVKDNQQVRMAEGKRVLSLEEQEQMDQEEIRELIQSGEVVLAQDLAA